MHIQLALALALVLIGLAQPPASESTLVIKGGSLFDPIALVMEPVQAITIERDKITAIGTPRKPIDIPKGVRVIDATGKFILPGLIDAHVHLVHRLNFAHVTGDEVLPLFLANGVTSVRDTGDEIVAQTLVAHFASSHPERCPRVFTASFLIDADPPIHRDIGLPVIDPAKVPALIDDMMAWKVTTLKVYAGSGRAVGRKVIEEGHRRGLFVTGHLSAYRAQDAIEDGIDCL
jgi:Amidohydrolase family